MTEDKHREQHEAFLRRVNALDRNYAQDTPESPEEKEWLEKRMMEIVSSEGNTSKENLPF
jgi:hypothetical protein